MTRLSLNDNEVRGRPGIVWFGPRCCKRDSYLAIQETMKGAAELDGTVWASDAPKCEHSARNKQCLETECTFFPKRGA